jgi:putative solute:sodium symporter small subunit
MPVSRKSPSRPAVPDRPALGRYWLANLRLMAGLLVVWAGVGLGCGVLFADRLDALGITLGGFPLGFWFAQQGSIIVFILLILAYALAMNRLDAQHHRDLAGEGPAEPPR